MDIDGGAVVVGAPQRMPWRHCGVAAQAAHGAAQDKARQAGDAKLYTVWLRIPRPVWIWDAIDVPL
jgi:hypothetical protein